ncbi:hypothetical protein FN846DRAFT_895253 [Sphaerosporella brunnea]|uniref:Uncharacterized protein n=1 Tax=Sphaerosporella brunnea TaxID=1250544 RepID=A0A5J5EH28_9PEZI|nr:hypothetical protein FN846DRAFT_895253 [Sphaerosporella brunnea]
MGKPSETATRDGGGEGAGGGEGIGIGSNIGKVSEDDDEFVWGTGVGMRRKPEEYARWKETVGKDRSQHELRVSWKHLHARQITNGTVNNPIPGGTVSSGALESNVERPTYTTAAISATTVPALSTSSSLDGPSQIVLSSTPPPSPVDFGPSLASQVPTPFFSSIQSNTPAASSRSKAGISSRSSSFSGTVLTPVTTITSFINQPTVSTLITVPKIISTQNSTATISSSLWAFSSSTFGGTVIVIASPTPASPISSSPTSTGSIGSLTTSHRSTTSFLSNSTRNRTSTTRSSTSFASATILVTSEPSTGGGGGGSGGSSNGIISTSSPLPTGSPSSSGSNVDPKLVGGILAGLVALAMLLGLILWLIKRHRRNLVIQARDEAGYGGPPPPGTISERSSANPFAAVAMFFRRRSGRDQAVAAEPASEERGFVKVTGRKLEPAIGGPRPPDRSLEGHRVYHEDVGTKGPITPVSSAGAGPSRFSGQTGTSISPTIASSTASFLGSPAGPTGGPAVIPAAAIPAVQEEGDKGDPPRSETPSTLSRPIPEFHHRPQLGGSAGRDGLGRSLPSHDGSRASRFTEDIV